MRANWETISGGIVKSSSWWLRKPKLVKHTYLRLLSFPLLFFSQTKAIHRSDYESHVLACYHILLAFWFPLCHKMVSPFIWIRVPLYVDLNSPLVGFDLSVENPKNRAPKERLTTQTNNICNLSKSTFSARLHKSVLKLSDCKSRQPRIRLRT